MACEEPPSRRSASPVSTDVNVNVEPTPGWLVTTRSPPIARASRRLITSPSPLPPYVRVVELSTWLKDWNNRSIRSAGIPIPVSRTLTARQTFP